MIHSNPIIHPNKQNHRFKFETFLRNEYNFGLDPDRPVCPFYNPQFPTTSCPNGSNCPHKHVSQMYKNKLVCKHWLRGLCKKGDNCEFLHEYNLRKMPECLFFSKNGYCTQTPECLYLHVDPQSKIPECMNYNAGFCAEGPNCKNRHVRKVFCPYYLAGFCPKGASECDFAHPKFNHQNLYLRIKPDPTRVVEAANGAATETATEAAAEAANEAAKKTADEPAVETSAMQEIVAA